MLSSCRGIYVWVNSALYFILFAYLLYPDFHYFLLWLLERTGKIYCYRHVCAVYKE